MTKEDKYKTIKRIDLMGGTLHKEFSMCEHEKEELAEIILTDQECYQAYISYAHRLGRKVNRGAHAGDKAICKAQIEKLIKAGYIKPEPLVLKGLSDADISLALQFSQVTPSYYKDWAQGCLTMKISERDRQIAQAQRDADQKQVDEARGKK